MHLQIIMIRISFTLIILVMLISCKSMDDSQISIYLEKSSSYKAQITRDVWGVPHVFGKTDADAAFGLAYAHAEDDFKNIAENMYLYRAEMGLKDGIDGALQDYLIKVPQSNIKFIPVNDRYAEIARKIANDFGNENIFRYLFNSSKFRVSLALFLNLGFLFFLIKSSV